MNCTANRLPYRQTHAFSRIAMDYIDQSPSLKPFFAHPPTLQGIQKAIAARKQFKTDRKLLVTQLQKQYEGVEAGSRTRSNIEALLSENTFTITTAHQNNIFTGPLYFIYKIMHVIRLADQLHAAYPDQQFVPVFYIGTEDADFDELNHTWVDGEKLTWNTRQTGAVGRMIIDQELEKLTGQLDGQLSVLPHGKEIVALLRQYYRRGTTIQDATFRFVNHLFADYGLVILLPDNASLKTAMIPLFEDDLLHQAASGIVEKSATALEEAGYKVQARPREINLFYLLDNQRERIEWKDGMYSVVNTKICFSREAMLQELKEHPERFSPNVILRGLYQETILPNIAFIGGGGETAYWLQLKDLFDHYQVPFPVLVLRNSFLLVEDKWKQMISRLSFQAEDFFIPEQDLLNKLVLRDSANETRLNGSMQEIRNLYDAFRKQATAVDTTLEKHVEALKARTLFKLQELEKKMLRAERRKFSDQQRQIRTIREKLFPGGGLQERRENIAGFYARYGKEILQAVYEHSPGLEQEFVVLQLAE